MTPDFRLATTADTARLATLVNSAYRGDSSRRGWTTEADLLGGQRTDPDALIDFIDRGPSNHDRVMLVGEAAGQPVACVQLERRGDEAYLGMLTIDPARQTMGLGKALLTAAEAWVLANWQTRRMTMTVIEQRLELIAWYERRGYQRTGETAAFPYGDSRFGEPKRADLRFVILAKNIAANNPRSTP